MNPLKLGFSPCPNDTFIFDALLHHRFPFPYRVEENLYDVEKLNRLALSAELEISKLSFAAYASVSDKYQILNAGAALGRNCGPLLISKNKVDLHNMDSLKVAIPGKYTTANLLLSIFFPQLTNKTEVVFSEIEDGVLSGEFDLGLIIHESRFTYALKGLEKVADLGECWESKFSKPIPLGCIAIRRDLPQELKESIQKGISDSVKWAFEHPQDSRDYIQKHAQELSPEVQQKHIDLYVNQFSIDLGAEGREAINLLLSYGHQVNLLPQCVEPIFINEKE
ncbi:MAG: 1,4-dihydroxy-6-naphthoate synthase [Bacteroidetes bacterium]|nr:1,4-dihydroxy-6-naphthoate synthase [Bacteroidota bacterium]